MRMGKNALHGVTRWSLAGGCGVRLQHRLILRDGAFAGGKCLRFNNSPLASGVSQTRCGHTVRVVLTTDLPEGRGFSGDVLSVQAGYARNFLIPQKKALYATPQNFERLGMIDPALEEKESEVVVATEEDEQAAEDARAADALRKYLRNKVLKIWRNVEPSTGAVHPGFVNHVMVRNKLSKQLRIDLEDHETVHLSDKELEVADEDIGDDQLESLLEGIGHTTADSGEETPECQVEIRQLGEFLAKITLQGGHTVPLLFAVVRR